MMLVWVGEPDPEDPVPRTKFGALDGSLEHGQLLSQGQVLGHQYGTTGKEASNEQPHCLKNAHPWTSVAEINSRTLRPKRRHGNITSPLPAGPTEFSGGTGDGDGLSAAVPNACIDAVLGSIIARWQASTC